MGVVKLIWLRALALAGNGWWLVVSAGAGLYACRAALLTLLVGGALLVLTDQARDMVLAGVGPEAPRGLLAGFVLVILLWATMGWFWSRMIMDSPVTAPVGPLPGDSPWRHTWYGWVLRYLPRLIGALSIVCVALTFQSGYAAYRDAGATAEEAVYGKYALGTAGLAVIFLLAVSLRRSAVNRVNRAINQGSAVARRTRLITRGFGWGLLGASLVASPVCFWAFTRHPIAASEFFASSVNVVLFGLAIITPVLSLLVWLSERARLPLFALAMILMAIVPDLTHDYHDVRLCKDVNPTTSANKCAAVDARGSSGELKTAFLEWWKANTADDMVAPLNEPSVTGLQPPEAVRVPPMIMVATAGGASRAAYWTAQVLAELAAREPHFSERLFMISGVSGGSLGATVFRSLVEEDRRRVGGRGSRTLDKAPAESDRFMKNDFLAPTLGVGLYADLPLGAVSPLVPHGFIDRATALEIAWEDAWRTSAEWGQSREFAWTDGFLKTFRGERPWPILALNGTSVVKGKRIITSNVDFHVSMANNQLNLGRTISQPESRYETFSILNADIPISTAVTMSARFPGISPTGGLRDDKRVLQGRITDGGLFENFGATTTDEIVRHLGSRIAEAQSNARDYRPIKPFIIVISSDPSLDPVLASYRLGNEPLVRTARQHVVSDCADGAKPEPSAGNRLLECPNQKLENSSVIADPLRALYSGRVARGEAAVATLFDRTRDLVDNTYDNLEPRIKLTDARRQLGEPFDVPLFHFRQCRIANRKGPTMSWHDSAGAWDVMHIMTGLHGSRDPKGTPTSAASGAVTAATDADQCGNAAEFLRLCVHLNRVTGVLDPATNKRAREIDRAEAVSAAEADCRKRWPAAK